MSSLAEIRAVAPAPPPLSAQQLRELQRELEHEMRWLTGTTALEWLSSIGEPVGVHVRSGPRIQNRLNQVIEALERIRAGSYGTCLECRMPISFERLQVIPETVVCIACSQQPPLRSRRGG